MHFLKNFPNSMIVDFPYRNLVFSFIDFEHCKPTLQFVLISSFKVIVVSKISGSSLFLQRTIVAKIKFFLNYFNFCLHPPKNIKNEKIQRRCQDLIPNVQKLYFFTAIFLCFLNSVSAQNSSAVSIGVIVDEDYLSNIADFFSRAVRIIESQSGLNYFSLNPRLDSQRRGCGTGDNRFDGAYLATELYYTDYVSAFFGPVCTDGNFWH